jgi:hypothetical protein
MTLAKESPSAALAGSAPRSGRGGRRFKSCQSDRHSADSRLRTVTGCVTEIPPERATPPNASSSQGLLAVDFFRAGIGLWFCALIGRPTMPRSRVDQMARLPQAMAKVRERVLINQTSSAVGRRNRYLTQQAHRCAATRRAQVSQRYFGTFSEAERSPHRMELSVQASGAVATD